MSWRTRGTNQPLMLLRFAACCRRADFAANVFTVGAKLASLRVSKLVSWTGISFDHLVGAGKQLTRRGEAERFRRLEIDHQFNLNALLDGEIVASAPHVLWRSMRSRLREL